MLVEAETNMQNEHTWDFHVSKLNFNGIDSGAFWYERHVVDLSGTRDSCRHLAAVINNIDKNVAVASFCCVHCNTQYLVELLSQVYFQQS